MKLGLIETLNEKDNKFNDHCLFTAVENVRIWNKNRFFENKKCFWYNSLKNKQKWSILLPSATLGQIIIAKVDRNYWIRRRRREAKSINCHDLFILFFPAWLAFFRFCSFYFRFRAATAFFAASSKSVALKNEKKINLNFQSRF